jgi:uncharacterized protein (DUF3820 family)
MNMIFGKWKGTPLEEIPRDYLEWLSGRCQLREPLNPL